MSIPGTTTNVNASISLYDAVDALAKLADSYPDERLSLYLVEEVERAARIMRNRISERKLKTEDMDTRPAGVPCTTPKHTECMVYGYPLSRIHELILQYEQATGRSSQLPIVDAHAHLLEQKKEYEASFELRWNADRRAVKMWQERHPGKRNVWPDHADLVVWALEHLDQVTMAMQAAKERADHMQQRLNEIRNAVGAALDPRSR